MPYNSLTSRTDAAALIPEDVAADIMQNVQYQSAAMALFNRVNMSRKQQRMPVLSALPYAYWVNGDSGLKQTTKVAWENKYITVEPLATIVPIPEDVLDDSEFDMWANIRPLLEQAVARLIDESIFFGVGKPASFPDALITGAVNAGNHVALGTAAAGIGGVAEDVNQLFGRVEADGYDVSGFVGRTGMRTRFRGARGTDGQALIDVSNNTLYGANMQFVMQGLWPKPAGAGTFGIDAIAGDFSQGIIGVRRDLEYKMLDQAPIFDNTGALMINLAQQDSVALRLTMRLGFQIANPINWENTDPTTRYPFAVLRTPGA